MPRGRAANGSGTIVKLKGRKNPYQIQYTVDGVRKYKSGFASHEEAAVALRSITASVDSRQYVDPQKMPLSQWLSIWLSEYCRDVKASSMVAYEGYVRNHIVPALGRVSLCDLNPHQIQTFINHLTRKDKIQEKPLAYKTIRNIHGCLSGALKKAVEIRYIRENPASGCSIPRPDSDLGGRDIHPLEGAQIPTFLKAIRGSRYERIYYIALCTGMRLSEILGLQWSRVLTESSELIVDRQLALSRHAGDARVLTATKSRNSRRIMVPDAVIRLLDNQKRDQAAWKAAAGKHWSNRDNLCFTDQFGNSLSHASVFDVYKRIVAGIGLPDRRFHDLRHTFATESIRAGVDYETLSKHLGHFSVAFTLDVYGHVTDAMKRDASSRMQAVIQSWENV